MRKIFSLLLVLCAIICLCSCKNTSVEEGFPQLAEPILSEVEGQRIPFKTLQMCHAKSEVKARMLVWYTQDEAQEGLDRFWLTQEEKSALLQKNFDIYALVALVRGQTASSGNIGELTEIVLRQPVVTMVYISDRPDSTDFTCDIIVPTTIVLVQKTDIQHLERSSDFSVQHSNALYKTCYPEQGVKYS